MNLEKGNHFQSKHFVGLVEIINVDSVNNELEVRIHRENGDYHVEDWNLQHTIYGFQRDEYWHCKSLVIQRLMDETCGWSQKTFVGQRNPAIVHHLKKEVEELIKEFETPYQHSQVAKDKITVEFADCFLLLLDSAGNFGLSVEQLVTASFKKLDVCKQRKWGKPDENGVIEHIKE